MSGKTVQVEFYAIISCEIHPEHNYARRGPLVRVTRSKPSLGKTEVAIPITMNLPTSLWQRPELSVNITVPDGGAPSQITADVMHNIAEVIRDQIGLTVTVRADGVLGDAV